MKKICFSILLMMIIVLCPDIDSYASTDEIEVYDSSNFSNFNDGNIIPGNEPLEFDEKGRITKGVIYVSRYVPYGLNWTKFERIEVTAIEGSCLYIAWSDTWDVRPGNGSKKLIFDSISINKKGSNDATNPDNFVFPFDINTSGAGDSGSNTTGVGVYNFVSRSEPNFYSFWTNIPIFQCNYSTPNDALKNYLEYGDYSAANNAPDVDNAKDATAPKNTYENNRGPWLKVNSFDGSNLTLRPVDSAYCSWYYTPQNTEGFTDLTIDITYSYQMSYEFLSNPNIGDTLYFSWSQSVYLNSFSSGFSVKPACVFNDAGDWFLAKQGKDCMFGGKAQGGIPGVVSTDVWKVTGSYLTVYFKLKGKKNGDWVNGSAVIEKVDLLDRTCTEVPAYSDEGGNYTPDNHGKVTDENGNVEVKNDIDINAPGGGGGGGSSSATGGSVGNITNTNNNTFKFPDHLTVDLNINGGGSGGGSSGSSSSSSGKKWYDRLLDAFGSLLDFLTGAVTKLFEALGDLLTTFADSVGDFVQYLFEGFGLFKNDGGIGSLIQENYSFVPPEVWRLVMFGIASVILVSIVNRFFK